MESQILKAFKEFIAGMTGRNSHNNQLFLEDSIRKAKAAIELAEIQARIEILNWSKLQRLYELARNNAVSFTMIYMEASDQFYFTIDSIVKKENRITGDFGFESALAVAIGFFPDGKLEGDKLDHGKYQKLVDIALEIAEKEKEPHTATNLLIRQALVRAGAMPWQNKQGK